MCGIYVIACPKDGRAAPSEYTLSCLQKRGPDHVDTIHVQLPPRICDDVSPRLSMTSTVLALRGDHLVKQPLVDEATGSVLCWNGEAWKIHDRPVEGNDGEALLGLLIEDSRQGRPDHVLETLRAVRGPFAFVFYDKPSNQLFFGRDRLGRRSLLMKPGNSFELCSVADPYGDGWQEVEADGIYSIHFDQQLLTPANHPWSLDTSKVSSIGTFNTLSTPSGFKLNRFSKSVAELHQHLLASLKLRVLNVPLPPYTNELGARVAILFSGGLDCTVLARLAHDLLPSSHRIDLVNVAFENPRIAAQLQQSGTLDLYELCPDRITGRKSFAELLEICPSRCWNFVTVNVPYASTLQQRETIIHLIHPHCTEMDLSIAYALYFAANAEGFCQSSLEQTPETYKSTARVLVSGLGADELFGGYQRHATAFSRRGYAGLLEELKLDVSRLGQRNLGRDDRAMSYWGKEVRFPYLDEDLVKWAIELPVWEKCDFENVGEGDMSLEPNKRVLRLLARKLGLASVATEKKRAIQFGARTAKMESGRVKGTAIIAPRDGVIDAGVKEHGKCL